MLWQMKIEQFLTTKGKYDYSQISIYLKYKKQVIMRQLQYTNMHKMEFAGIMDSYKDISSYK